MHAPSQYGWLELSLLRLARGLTHAVLSPWWSVSGAHCWMTRASMPNLLSYRVAGTRFCPFTHAGFHLVESQLIGLTPPLPAHTPQGYQTFFQCRATFALLLLVGRLGTMLPISAIPTGGTPSTGGLDIPSGSQATVTSVTPNPDMLLSLDQLANLLLCRYHPFMQTGVY